MAFPGSRDSARAPLRTGGKVIDQERFKRHVVGEPLHMAQVRDRRGDRGMQRRQDEQDARTMRIRLTAKGSRLLRRLSTLHQDEVRHLAGLPQPILDRQPETDDD